MKRYYFLLSHCRASTFLLLVFKSLFTLGGFKPVKWLMFQIVGTPIILAYVTSCENVREIFVKRFSNRHVPNEKSCAFDLAPSESRHL